MKKEIDADEQEAFIREVTEEVKNDNLKQMWEKYGIYIILLVVLAIVGAVSFEGFKSWRQAKSETWSDTYAYALNLENQGKYDESLKVLEQMEKTGGNIYSDIARLQTSNILFEQGKNEEAIKVLEEIAADKSINKKAARRFGSQTRLLQARQRSPRRNRRAFAAADQGKRQLGKHCQGNDGNGRHS